MDNENDIVSLGARLRDGSLYQRAPDHLRAQIVSRVRSEAAPARRASPDKRSRWSWPAWATWSGPFVGGTLAGSALCALAFTAFLTLQRPAPSDGIAQEVVSSHVRALISDRTMDVLSSDKHTVKPWFNGRIDYVPPVVDPREPGFALVGGRLDYVGHRPVAVLVYRYLKHPIDVYVFPDGSHAASAPAGKPVTAVTQSDDGYALANWHRDGMSYWAVSDASSSVLRQFAQALQTDESR